MNYKTFIEKAKMYCPIRIFSIRLGYGWWWGRYFYFLGKHSTDFAIIPMSLHFSYCTYEHGMAIMDGDTLSWSKSRQREKIEDEERHSHHLNSITIKFRGQTEDGDWLYGDLRQRIGYWPAIIESYCTDEGKVGYREIAVKEKTVGQFTGLYDKNGKEIYEGDIVEFGKGRYVCEFVEGGFQFKDLVDGRFTLNAIANKSKVIGNIHDNPEYDS